MAEKSRFRDKPVDLEREDFLVELTGELSGVLQDLVGLDSAKGLIAIVGARIGDRLNAEYRRQEKGASLDAAAVSDAAVDLKARIGGDFYEIERTEDEIVLGNRHCPFGRMVEGRPALCMMTSNIFGRIAAENLGYARVSVEEAIANGHDRCLVRIALTPPGKGASVNGREYFRTDDVDD
jgi:predicted ArsR family transcriptional regulator